MNKPQRADGRRNRAAILEAAADIFAEFGVDVPLDHIAKAAGVGRATLYRNFPDRESLALAVFERNVDAYEAMLAEVSGPDGFERVLKMIMIDTANYAGLGALMIKMGIRHEVLHIRDRVISSLLPLARMAQSAGRLRDDLGADDLAMILAASAGGIEPLPPEDRRGAAERLFSLLIEGLRPAPEAPLSPQPGSSAAHD